MKRFTPVLIALLFATSVRAEDWPCWRGPRLDGSSLEKSLPLKWSVVKDKKTGAVTMENIAWQTEIPGLGHSSPIVHGDRVFLTTCLLKEEKRVLLCLARKDGKILWQREVASSPLEPRHQLNSYSSSTPATDGKYVYTTFVRIRKKTDNDGPPSKPREKPRVAVDQVPEIVVGAYDFEGNKAWERIPGRFYSPHGFCSSPILYKDKVIVRMPKRSSSPSKRRLALRNGGSIGPTARARTACRSSSRPAARRRWSSPAAEPSRALIPTTANRFGSSTARPSNSSPRWFLATACSS
jgi:hypothetical protein